MSAYLDKNNNNNNITVSPFIADLPTTTTITTISTDPILSHLE
jgi:hypothetical protein